MRNIEKIQRQNFLKNYILKRSQMEHLLHPEERDFRIEILSRSCCRARLSTLRSNKIKGKWKFNCKFQVEDCIVPFWPTLLWRMAEDLFSLVSHCCSSYLSLFLSNFLLYVLSFVFEQITCLKWPSIFGNLIAQESFSAGKLLICCNLYVRKCREMLKYILTK